MTAPGAHARALLRTRIHLAVLCAAAFCGACGHHPDHAVASTGGQSGDADLVLRNASVYTMDERLPRASAVAIGDGVIQYVGSDEGAADRIGSSTRVMDLHGRLVLPAFHDAHVHPLWAGLEYSQCPLLKLTTTQEYLDAVVDCHRKLPAGAWLVGSGWSVSAFAPTGIPDKRLLDAVVPDRPVILYSRDGHSIWTNTRAMEIAGITAATPDPENGRIDRDPQTGEPVGSFQEAAATRMVFRHATPPTDSQLRDGALAAIREMNSLGIVSWQEADVPIAAGDSSRILPTYLALRDTGQLPGHTVLALEWDNNRGLEQLDDIRAAAQRATGGNVRAHTVKFFLDGVIETHTAALVTEYADRPGYTGEIQVPASTLNAAVAILDREGFQVHMHAIGDGAVRAGLDAYEHARAVNGLSANRHHIAHLQLVHPDDMARFAELDVTANFQPLWAEDNDYMKLAKARLGDTRMKFVYPIHSVLATGARVAFGSDWSVSSVNPLEGIEVAVTRLAPGADAGAPFLPLERITLDQAIRAYTLNAAFLNHRDDHSGTLAAGKDADLIVLDRNILAGSPADVAGARVLLTLNAGKAVHGALEAISAP
jgi:hypothetical protein